MIVQFLWSEVVFLWWCVRLFSIFEPADEMCFQSDFALETFNFSKKVWFFLKQYCFTRFFVLNQKVTFRSDGCYGRVFDFLVSFPLAFNDRLFDDEKKAKSKNFTIFVTFKNLPTVGCRVSRDCGWAVVAFLGRSGGFSLLEHPQELYLCAQVDVADLIKE